MPLFPRLFGQANIAVYEDTDMQGDIAEIDEEIEDAKHQFLVVTQEVAEAAKEALSKRTLSQYERYQTPSVLSKALHMYLELQQA